MVQVKLLCNLIMVGVSRLEKFSAVLLLPSFVGLGLCVEVMLVESTCWFSDCSYLLVLASLLLWLLNKFVLVYFGFLVLFLYDASLSSVFCLMLDGISVASGVKVLLSTLACAMGWLMLGERPSFHVSTLAIPIVVRIWCCFGSGSVGLGLWSKMRCFFVVSNFPVASRSCLVANMF